MDITNNPDIIKLDLPMRDGADGYLGLFFRYYSMLAGIIADSRNETDHRISLLTNLIIATVPDDDKRDLMKKLKEALIEEKIAAFTQTNHSPPSQPEKSKIVIDCCMDIIGEVTGYIDMFLGASKQLSVIIENPMKKLEESGQSQEVVKEIC